MQSNSSGSRYLCDINVTPLVDIVLVLLIIFMAAAPMMNHKSIGVNVPQAAHGENQPTETLEVRCVSDGGIFLDGVNITREDLGLDLARRTKSNGTLHVSLVADKANSYGDVIEILDIIRSAGVKKMGLEVKPRPKK